MDRTPPSTNRPLYAPELTLLFTELATPDRGVLTLHGPFHTFTLDAQRDVITQRGKNDNGHTIETFSLDAAVFNPELALLCESVRKGRDISHEQIDFTMRHNGMLGVSGRFRLHAGDDVYLWDPSKAVLAVSRENGSHVRLYDFTTTPTIIEPTLETLYLRNLHHHAQAVTHEGKRAGIELAHRTEHGDGQVSDYDYTTVSRILEPRNEQFVRNAHDVHKQAVALSAAVTHFSALNEHDATRVLLLAHDDLISTPTLIGLLASHCRIEPYLEILEKAQEKIHSIRAHPTAIENFEHEVGDTPGFFTAYLHTDVTTERKLHDALRAGYLDIADIRTAAIQATPDRLLSLIENATAYRKAALEHSRELSAPHLDR